MTSAMVASAVFLKDRMFGKIALLLFLLSLPLSIRKVFLVISPEGTSGFNEYTDISLYLSDILLLCLLAIFILENKNSILSILWWKQLFHVEHFKVLFFAPIPLLLWSGLSIFWSKSHLLGAYSFSRLLEGYLLYILLVLYFVPRGTNTDNDKKCSTWNIVFLSLIVGGVVQSGIAILQFSLQSSLGLSFLRESILFPGGTGVAKIILAQESLIRPYGLFPHPNVLAGFLGVTILFTIAYPLIFSRKLFHVEQLLMPKKNDQNFSQIVPRGTIQKLLSWIRGKFSTWNNLLKNPQLFHVEQSISLYRLILGVQIIGFLLTFSKSAFLGLLLATGYFIYKMFHVEQSRISLVRSEKNVPRGTLQNFLKIRQLFHVEQFKSLCRLLLGIVVLETFIFLVNWHYFFFQPLKERIFLQKTFFAVLSQFPWQGVGIGQSVFIMQDFFTEKLFSWQFQPVHSLPLLIFSETGIIGLILFSVFIIGIIAPRGIIQKLLSWIREKCSTWNNLLKASQLFHVEQSFEKSSIVPHETVQESRLKILSEAVFIFIGVTSLLDHYLWDIQQGQLLFWLIMGFLASTRLFLRNIDK